MPGTLGNRKRIGLVVPSTNTTVQPETDMSRVPGMQRAAMDSRREPTRFDGLVIRECRPSEPCEQARVLVHMQGWIRLDGVSRCRRRRRELVRCSCRARGLTRGMCRFGAVPRRSAAEMSRKLQLTFACGDYEIMRALKEGVVQPDGIELTVLTDMAASPRHWRFLRGREFDVAEVSGSGYIAARDRELPFRAIPVFPHRRFRHGFIFVNTSKGITQAYRPDRPQGRNQRLSVHRRPVDARHPRA